MAAARDVEGKQTSALINTDSSFFNPRSFHVQSLCSKPYFPTHASHPALLRLLTVQPAAPREMNWRWAAQHKQKSRYPGEFFVFQTIILKQGLLKGIMLVYNYLWDQNLPMWQRKTRTFLTVCGKRLHCFFYRSVEKLLLLTVIASIKVCASYHIFVCYKENMDFMWKGTWIVS